MQIKAQDILVFLPVAGLINQPSLKIMEKAQRSYKFYLVSSAK